MTDSRTPTTHAASHATAGSDPITVAQSQVTNLTTDLAGKAATAHTHAASAISDSTAVGRSLITATDVTAAQNALSLSSTFAAQPSGTPDGTKFFRDDNTWVTPAGGSSDHGALTGLGDDDHAQYALADGSRGSFATTTHAASHATAGSDPVTIEPAQVTGLPGTLGNVVMILDPAAARVHPITGAALDPGVVVIWNTDTEPTNMISPPDIWLDPERLVVSGAAYEAVASGTAHSVSNVADVVDGDTLVVLCVIPDGATTASTPTGYTQVMASAITGCTVYVWTKDAVAADALAAVETTLSASEWVTMISVRARNTPASALAQSGVTTAASGVSINSASFALAITATVLQFAAVASPSATGAETVVTQVSEDTYVQDSTPTTNYGTSTQLASRVSGPVMESYLKFSVAAAPAGKTLVAARLKFRTTTDPASGSTAAQDFSFMSDNTWNAATLTWDTRPAISGPVLGTLAGGSTTDTVYSVPLTLTELATALGGNFAIAMSTGGVADGFFINSVNHAAETYRPTLELDFETPTADLAKPTLPTDFTEVASAATAGASASSSAIRVGHLSLRALRAGQSVGGQAWGVSNVPQQAGTLAIKVAMP